MVDSPDTELFEQASFIVRNDAMNRNGVTAQRLVDEACRVARTCGRTATCSKRSFFRRGSPALWGCIGAGGIASARDVVEMMLAGATAVEIGAANLINPCACRNILDELPAVMEAYHISSLKEIIGGAHEHG